MTFGQPLDVAGAGVVGEEIKRGSPGREPLDMKKMKF